MKVIIIFSSDNRIIITEATMAYLDRVNMTVKEKFRFVSMQTMQLSVFFYGR